MLLKKTFLATLSLFTLAASAHASPITARIIDGVPASELDFPYVAQLTLGGDELCTGTLVAPRFILTAAHCFFDDRNRQVIGNNDVVARLGGITVHSQHVYLHPNYRSRSQACVEGEVDAAIVELSQEVSGIATISLMRSPVPQGATIKLVGYGVEGTGQKGENDHLPADGTVNVGNTIVEGFGDSPPQKNNDSTYYFWRFDSGESNTASGDSGGPAFYNDAGNVTLSGITCGGEGQAEFGTYSFNTRADKIAPWADSIIGTTAPSTAPGFISPSTASGNVGAAFSFSVQTTGTSPVSVSASGLPDGLTFDSGTISGTPTAAGSFDVLLSAHNDFGDAQSSLKITIANFSPTLSVKKTLLQFDYTDDAEDFLDISGKISVGQKFNPKGKRIELRIGRFFKKFKLGSDGLSTGSTRDTFDLEGAFRGRAFAKASVSYFISLENLSLFDELSTLGFPDSATASAGQRVALPISITINGVEQTTTVMLEFQSRDERWRLAK